MRGSKPGEFRESGLHRSQTEARIAKGVAALKGELSRQCRERRPLDRNGNDVNQLNLADTRGDDAIVASGLIDLRALYLAVDERASAWLRKRETAPHSPSSTPQQGE